MTTTVKVHVNGDYIATVRTTNMTTGKVNEEEINAVGISGGVERAIANQHPTDLQITIKERYAPTQKQADTAAPAETNTTDKHGSTFD
jgi:hypothetical protein